MKSKIQTESGKFGTCFLGSGTTAQVCESLGIRWVGFETNLQYRRDIRNRIREGMLIYAESQTQNLGEY